jgi:hypothetical protein
VLRGVPGCCPEEMCLQQEGQGSDQKNPPGCGWWVASVMGASKDIMGWAVAGLGGKGQHDPWVYLPA